MRRSKTFRACAVLAVAGAVLDASQPASQPTSRPTASAPGIQPVVLIEGQVVDSMGAGIDGVKVVARLKTGTGEPRYLNTTTTNEMGDLKIMGDPSCRGTVVVTLSKWGFKDFAAEVELGAGGATPFLDVSLRGAVVLFGVVCDARSGSGIGGATVKVDAKFRGWKATSQSDGKFRIGDLFPGQAVVTVDATGYGRARYAVERLEDFGELVVLLKPERVVHLTTVDQGANPVAGASVECVSEEPYDYRSATSDDQGSIVLRGIHRDATLLRLRVSCDGFVASVGFDREIPLPDGVDESHHSVVLLPAAVLRGMVADAGTGAPLNGARVVVGDGPADLLPRAWTDFQGTYRLDGIVPGETPVTVHLSGYAPELTLVTCEAGRETAVEFKLARGQSAAGIVVDDAGRPVPDAHVYATRWRGHQTLGLQAVTDAQGRFVIDSAPTDEFVVAVQCKGHLPLRNATVQAGRTDPRFELKRGGAAASGQELRIGQDAPPLDLTTLDGKRITSADLKGKWVLLDFWATWCGPCRQEVPNLKAVHAALGRRDDLVMIGVSLDTDEHVLRRFVTDNGMEWVQAFGGAGGASQAAADYGVEAIPWVVLVDPSGKIAAIDLRGAQMKEDVERFLKRPP